jgi:hypothetical protein
VVCHGSIVENTVNSSGMEKSLETSGTSADLVEKTLIRRELLRLTRGDAEPANVLATR